ncbi:hypothetical protein SERLADRAFT_402010 [Serpula lacrymans var. lacrymans S7.9]|uniref:Uncharacterized protein n=1 Tax=Serpula lacrymans var. lacrymans (strain S7.9) TaxID=578457 RepID=F8PBA5_SERL9|nr:uncharacterized protein SERLADRAFT_402010 [Serpula lacrymans var. lacrymans S7.9]EGO19545.1 hypothetical protein SERLADRAFT_402010 [Serpula lacrymans var. lacrymans S7.9]
MDQAELILLVNRNYTGTYTHNNRLIIQIVISNFHYNEVPRATMTSKLCWTYLRCKKYDLIIFPGFRKFFSSSTFCLEPASYEGFKLKVLQAS